MLKIVKVLKHGVHDFQARIVPSQYFNVIHYELLTLSLKIFKFSFPAISLIFKEMNSFHQVMLERTQHKAVHP